MIATNRLYKAGLLLCAALLLSNCTSRVASRGHLPSPELLADIRVGEYNKNDVLDTLGSPSSTIRFDEEVWFYISKKTETTIFFPPLVVERKTVIIRFDDDGLVKNVETRGLDEARMVALAERATPTTGHSLGFFEQLLGNLGRFEKRQ